MRIREFDINLVFNLRVVKMADEPKRSLRTRQPPKFHNSEGLRNLEDDEVEKYATLANPTSKKVHTFLCRRPNSHSHPPMLWPNSSQNSLIRPTHVFPHPSQTTANLRRNPRNRTMAKPRSSRRKLAKPSTGPM